jgi:hypothetical protein
MIYFLISFIATWRFMFNYKTQQIIEFEELYLDLKRKSIVQRNELRRKRDTNPTKYYSTIIAFFIKHFPGVHFDYKL